MKEIDLKEIEEKINESELADKEPVKTALKKRLRRMREKLDNEIKLITRGNDAV